MEERRNIYFMVSICILLTIIGLNLYTLTRHFYNKAKYDKKAIPSIHELFEKPDEIASFFITADGKSIYLVRYNGSIEKNDSFALYRDGEMNLYRVDEETIYEIKPSGLFQKTGTLRWRYFQWGIIKGSGFGRDYSSVERMLDEPLFHLTSLTDPPPFIISVLMLFPSIVLFLIRLKKKIL